MTKFCFPVVGGTLTYDMPVVTATLGFWVSRSLIPDSPEWEWAVTNIPANIFPGLVNGYADTEDAARHALRAALAFWRARGYTITQEAPWPP